MRAEVKELSRQVGQAKKAGNEAEAAGLSARSREIGEAERAAAAAADVWGNRVRTGLSIYRTSPPTTRRTAWARTTTSSSAGGRPGRTPGGPSPEPSRTSRYPRWEISEALQILDMDAGRGSPLRCSPSTGAGGAVAAGAHPPCHRPPLAGLRGDPVADRRADETMISTGRLPKLADDAYHLDATAWADPDRGGAADLDPPGRDPGESQLPLRFAAATTYYGRGAAARGPTRGGCCGCARTRSALRVPGAGGRARCRPTFCGGPSRCCRSSSCPSGCSTCAAATSAGDQPGHWTSSLSHPGSIAGSR